jgi:hypothetical protein
MGRLIALVILLIPISVASLGIKLMRDMLFGALQSPIPSLPLQFLIGFIFFIVGLGFISGFVLYRDRKRDKVQKRLKKRKAPPKIRM